MILCQKLKIDQAYRIALPRELVREAGLDVGSTLYVQVDEKTKSLIITDGKHNVSCLWLNIDEMHHKNI